MKRPLVLYFSSELFLSFGIGLVNYAQPFFYRSAGLSDGSIGTLFAVNSFTAGIAAFVLSPMADRVGASRVFKLSTLLLAASFLGTGLTTSFVVWLVMSGLMGIGAGLLMSTENVVLSSLMRGKEKASILSKFVALYMFLIGLGVVSSGFLSSGIGYQNTVLTGGMVAMVAPIIRVFVKAPDARSNTLFRWPSRRVLAMSGYAVLFSTALGLFSPFVTLVLSGNFGLGDRVISMISAASIFTVSFGSFIVSMLLKRFRRERTLLFSFVLAVIAMVGMALTGQALWFIVLFLGRTTVTSIPGSIVDAMFLDLTHETQHAQMFGVRVFGNSLGNSFGAYAGGLLLNRHWLSGLMWISAAGVVIAYAYLTRLLSRVQHHMRLPIHASSDHSASS